MNNSAEVEKWINHLEQKLNEFANPPKGGMTTMPMAIPIGVDEARVILQLIAREKELASLTDEVIEGMATKVYPSNGLSSTDTARAIFSHHIKLFRDHLKQNNLKK